MSENPKQFSTTSEKKKRRKKRRHRRTNEEADETKPHSDTKNRPDIGVDYGKGKFHRHREEEIGEIRKEHKLESNPLSRAEKRQHAERRDKIKGKPQLKSRDAEEEDSDDFFQSKMFISSAVAINVIFISGAIVLFALSGSCSESLTYSISNTPYSPATQSPYNPYQTNPTTNRPDQPGPATPYIPKKTTPVIKQPLNTRPPPTQATPSGNSGSENSNDPFLIEEDHFTVSNFKCGVPSVQPDLQRGRIVGGAEAVPNSWPYAASFGTYDISGGQLSVSQMCGSTIISPRHALTAAHCFMLDPNVEQTYYIFMGLHDETTYKGVRPNKVVGVRFHPKTNVFTKDPWLVYDFAVLTMRKEIIPNERWTFACLPEPKNIPTNGKICWGVGWGKTQNTGGDDVLKQVPIDVVSERRCREEYKSSISIKSTMCGGTTPGQDTCQGDSGGPLFCKENEKWYIQGVVSYGPAKCGTGPMAAYGTVAYNLGWICCYMPDLPSCKVIKCNESGEN